MSAWDRILQVARTSEFWIVVSQAVVTAFAAPIPEEVRYFAWVYVALRIVSKVAKFIFPNPDNPSGEFLKQD